jgi:CRP-like cAMP-binding protein
VLIYMVPDRQRLIPLRFLVHQNILRNLHYAGIEIPVQTQEIRVRRSPPPGDAADGIVRLLRQSALFAELTAEETGELAQASTQHLCHAGEPILKQGNPGTSLFILNEGLLGVWVANAAGTDTQVAQIQPGEFFGELSLLTGEPRGATVIPVTDCLVTEIGKEAMSKLLEARPDLADSLSHALARRQAANQRWMADTNLAGTEPEGLARQLLGRIRMFFNLSAAPAKK